MASRYKTFLNDDVVTTRTLLHEAIPITGSIIYGTYGLDGGTETHTKKFAHGMFQSVYDYPYLSSSANHIFDIAYGHHADNANAAASTAHAYHSKRKNIYNQMAQVLMGHDASGNILKFDADGDIIAGGEKYTSCIFLNFARLLNKDEVKKGSFEIQLGVHGTYHGVVGTLHGEATTQPQAASMHTQTMTIKDDGAATDYRVNSPAGEYGILKVTADDTANTFTDRVSGYANMNHVGLIFYQAGIAVLTTDVFVKYKSGGTPSIITPGDHESATGKLMADGSAGTVDDQSPSMYKPGASASPQYTIDGMIQTVALTNDQLLNSIRKRIEKVCFNNTTELNSTIYFCRVNHNDFNYSSNPTYLNSSKIRVKNTQSDAPVSYITSVGLYSSDNELLAVAKLSEPLRKDPTNDMTLRVRLDY